MITHLATALGLAGASSFNSDMMRLFSGPAPAPTRNGGRRGSVAQDQRRAAKRRATRRAKRLGHQ